MVDHAFHIGQFEQTALPEGCSLVIELGTAHLVLLAWHRQSGTAIALDYYQLQGPDLSGLHRQVLLHHPARNLNWEKILISIFSHESILMPEQLHKAGQSQRMLNMIHGDLHNGPVREDQLIAPVARNYYRFSPNLEETVAELFKEAVVIHGFSAVLRVQHQREASFPDTYLYVQIYNRQVSITVMISRMVHLVQIYPYDIPEDISYHLLNVCEQKQADPDEIPVYISGLVDLGSPLYAELHKYFRNLETDAGQDLIGPGEAFDGQPEHFFTPQILLTQCG